MAKGVHLTLMIGPAVPVPVSEEVLNALTGVQVTSRTDGPSAFQLTFSVSARSPLQTVFMLSAGASIPLVRVVIVVTVNGASEVLMDGVMTNHQITPGGEGGQSTLTVTGEDLTRVMDYLNFDGIPYPAMPPEARVLLILAKYALFGVVPFVVPSVLLDVPIPTESIPRHQGTDLEYVKRLAEEVGYVFYVDPGPAPGSSVAYWGPEIKVGVPQPALNINMDTHTNVESLSFTYDSESKKLPIVIIQNQATKVPIPIPIPDITPLNPPLGAVPPLPKDIEVIRGAAKLSPIRAALIGLAKAARTSDAVSASGSLDVLRYGRVLKPRRLIGVRGAGLAFDGLYYVKNVTHDIKRGEYKQSFALGRNGLISTLPKVPA
ncbi:MAG TPA: hypothetical protein VNH22_14225 [Blastocatellia bacterium]|jgi:hypothetical protein|nr:hypothetical protein [Blastocatellia bacterium]